MNPAKEKAAPSAATPETANEETMYKDDNSNAAECQQVDLAAMVKSILGGFGV